MWKLEWEVRENPGMGRPIQVVLLKLGQPDVRQVISAMQRIGR
jgi:hypothetical protein